MNTDTLVLFLIFWYMSYHFWMIRWMKNVNIFSNSKISGSRCCLSIAWFFANFSPPLLVKVLLIRKRVYINCLYEFSDNAIFEDNVKEVWKKKLYDLNCLVMKDMYQLRMFLITSLSQPKRYPARVSWDENVLVQLLF